MSLANVQGRMSRSEMKTILGGNVATCTCKCKNNQVGEWQYTSQPSPATILHDAGEYCTYGATCTGCHNNPD